MDTNRGETEFVQSALEEHYEEGLYCWGYLGCIGHSSVEVVEMPEEESEEDSE